MNGKAGSGIMLTLLSIYMLVSAFYVQPVKASGTIYIRADGSIDPSTAPIQRDGDIFTFIDNINNSIVVERSNIIIDGNGYTLQSATKGFEIHSIGNVTIKHTNIRAHLQGVYLNSTSQNHILENNITAQYRFGSGVYLSSSSDNHISRNNITNSQDGVCLYRSSNNHISGNIITKCEDGIRLEWYSNHNRINDNNVTASSRYGVPLAQVCSNNSVSGNNIVNNWVGIWLFADSNHNTVSGNNIANSMYGVHLKYSCNYNSINGNNVTDNWVAIPVEGSSQNSIAGNNIKNNSYYGIYLDSASNNSFYHNNFVDNSVQVEGLDYVNEWDNGYPSGGNYWSNYTGIDEKNGPNQDQTGSDGIGDTLHVVDMNNRDCYPLMAPVNVFNAGTWNNISYNVDVVSNSTVSDFYFNPSEGTFLQFNVTGESKTSGFCRVAISKDLLWVEDGWTVLVDGEQIIDYKIIPDENYTYMFFTYNHSTKMVQIKGTHAIPEFPSAIIISLFMVATLLVVIVHRRKQQTARASPSISCRLRKIITCFQYSRFCQR